MRNLVPVLVLVLVGLALPSALAAEVAVRHRPASEAPAAASPVPAGAAGLAEKLDLPADTLLVPYFEVDTTNPAGTTTLFAVRNITSAALTIEVEYLSTTGDSLRQDLIVLAARETLTRNVRDVAGLPVDPDGFARGLVVVTVDSPPGDSLVGDYLQVDVANAFATGDRMVSLPDFCNQAGIRFFDFGTGTTLRFLLEDPQGSDSDSDPASFAAAVVAEDGTVVEFLNVFTDQNSLTLNTSELTDLSFGTLLFNFTASSGGTVAAEYSAEGRFSVGMNGNCFDI